MKNVMLLFGVFAFLSFGFISCSSDDDGPTDTANSNLYGTWATDYSVEDGAFIPGSDACDQKFEYDFSRNGNFSVKTFTGTDPDNCLENAQTFGNWEYLGDDKYLIHDNNITITDQNRDNYTVHLDFISSTEVRSYTLANYNADANTFTVLRKQ